jgi:3-dehydroquinate synthetase
LRGDVIVALGGGIVGDTAGYLAASYYRGVDIVQVPTTLLAQVDAAIGGKTAVNLPEGKNLVGAFHQPIAVIADTATLATLPAREYRAGLGEVLKYALLGDDALLSLIEAVPDDLLERNPALLAEVVARCAAIKAKIVELDEYERTGRRATLNLGHTLGHALESVGNYDLLHGEAVAVGCVYAYELAARLGRVPESEAARVRQLAERLDLPVTAAAGDAAELVAFMRRDKKAAGGLTFVLPGPDGVTLVPDVPEETVIAAMGAVGVGS